MSMVNNKNYRRFPSVVERVFAYLHPCIHLCKYATKIVPKSAGQNRKKDNNIPPNKATKTLKSRPLVVEANLASLHP